MNSPDKKNKIEKSNIKEYIRVLRRRKFIILIAFVAVVSSTYYYVYKIEDIYESYATIVIEEENSLVNSMMNVRGRSLSFYEGILNSRSFLQSVVDSVGLENFEALLPKCTYGDALEYIQNNLSLRKTSFTSFMHLTARAKTKNAAHLIACVGTEQFKKRCHEVVNEESRRAMEEIEKQLSLIRENLEMAEQDYRTFSEAAGRSQDGSSPELKTLQEAYATSLAQLGLREADLNAEKEILTKLEKKITPNNKNNSKEYNLLKVKLMELEKEKMRLESLGVHITGISTVNRKIREIEKKMLQYQQTSVSTDPALVHQWQELRKSVINKEAEMELFKRKLNAYKSAIQQFKKNNPNIMGKSLELLQLKRSKEIYENLYTILLEKAEEEKIKSAASAAGIKVVDSPTISEKPIPKNEIGFYIIGIALGIGLGLGIAFLVEFNDTSITTNEDVENYLEIAVLGTIPHIVMMDKQKRKDLRLGKKKYGRTHYPRHLFNFEGDDSVITESYRSLRTNISFVSPDKVLKTILVTSVAPSEGKSLTISNLAMAYAQMGKRTLLIDVDLRRPVIHHVFKYSREPGLTDLFIGTTGYEKIIRKTEKENLFLITAGRFTPNPAELIGSNKMMQHIEYFKNEFDVILFDAPPIIAVTDATLLGVKVDGVLMVIKSNFTERNDAIRAMSLMKNVGVHVFGAVLNDIDLSHRYSSYSYYKYYYHYYNTKAEPEIT